MRTAFEDGYRPQQPAARKWRSPTPLTPRQVCDAWEYMRGAPFPRTAQQLLPDLCPFSFEAITWAIGHPAVRRRNGRPAVEALFQQLVKQSNQTLGEQQRREDLERKQALQQRLDTEEAADLYSRRSRKQKPSTWRLGRGPGSFGGNRGS